MADGLPARDAVDSNPEGAQGPQGQAGNPVREQRRHQHEEATEQDLIEQLRDLLRESVKLHEVSDGGSNDDYKRSGSFASRKSLFNIKRWQSARSFVGWNPEGQRGRSAAVRRRALATGRPAVRGTARGA